MSTPHEDGGALGGPPNASSAPRQPPPSMAPRANRGCAVAAVTALALTAALLLGAGVWAVVRLASGPGGYAQVPECGVADGAALDELVPEGEAEVDEPLPGQEEAGREGVQCRWATTEDSEVAPSAVRLVMVRTGDGGAEGAQGATDLLAGASQRHERTALSGPGDEAYSWYDGSQGPLGWGCVGYRTANLYVESCYSSAADYAATEPVPGADMTDGAKTVAHAVMDALDARD